jgi:hypothetical protein
MNSVETGTDMTVIAAKGLVFSAWAPSPEELELLSGGHPLWLIQRGPFIPEMTLRVGSQENVVPHDMMRAAVTDTVAPERPKVKPSDRAIARMAAIAIVILVALSIWEMVR